MAIRGAVTTNPAPTWEPTVGMYVDGVFIGKVLGGIFDVADLERVEVLRGPQGSLYGKNTVGGAVNLITRKPSGELMGEVKAGVGNEGYWQMRGSLDTPAIGTVGEGLGQLSANITLQHEERDGFTRGVADPVGSPLAAPDVADEWDGLDSDAGRVALLLNVTEEFEARYTYDFSDKQNTPQAPHLTHADPNVVPFLLPYVVSEDERSDKLSSNIDVYEEADIEGHALHLGYDLGEQGFLGNVQLRSITAYREMKWDDLLDIDGSPIDAFHSGRGIDYDQTSQELQIVGSTDRVNYVLGYYYFDETADVHQPDHLLRRLRRADRAQRLRARERVECRVRPAGLETRRGSAAGPPDRHAGRALHRGGEGPVHLAPDRHRQQPAGPSGMGIRGRGRRELEQLRADGHAELGSHRGGERLRALRRGLEVGRFQRGGGDAGILPARL